MALEPAWMLGVDDLGVSCFKSTRRGYSALTAGATEYGKLNFHSSWPRIESVHEVGTVLVDFRNAYAGPVGGPSPGIFSFATPVVGYRPIITWRRRVAGVTYADEWYTASSAANDPYASYMFGMTNYTGFQIYTGPFSFTNDEGNPLLGTIQTIDYVIWKLGADVLT